MKQILNLFAIAFAATATLTSCIQDEAPNAECDILTVELPENILEATPVITNNAVTIRVRSTADISRLAPAFTITDGATITPASGSVQDFANAENNIVYYTVKSEDGQWEKTYPVQVIQRNIASEYTFNSSELDASTGQYTIFSEIDENGNTVMTWASGNPGYVMCGMAPNMASQTYGESYRDHIYEFFPTAAVYPEGTTIETDENSPSKTKYFMKDGKKAVPEYIRLVTRTTGFFGNSIGMPIAAGNIFQGYFQTTIATQRPREATKFGEPYRYEPVSFSGSYRYKAGEIFTDENGNTIQGKKDIFSIYALFYETDENTEYIDGSIHEMNFSHPNLVAIATLPNPHESEEWVDFDIPFAYVSGKTIDYEKLNNGEYKIGIVISSSADGDFFRGAVGSTLDVKNLKIDRKKEIE